MDRRKQLKELYKNTKSDMGVFIIKSNSKNKCLVEESKNLRASLNRARFQLDYGSYPNRELQSDWKQDGASSFTIEVLDILKYKEDEPKTDYSEELSILKSVWEDKLSKEGFEFYKK